jgi:hypothetical protein
MEILEVGATPPGDEGIGVSGPALSLEEWCGDGAQAALHIDHGTILLEHAQLDRGLQALDVGHGRLPMVGLDDKPSSH